MDYTMDRNSLRTTLAGLGLLIAAHPLQADVKVGVDAWTRGDFPSAVREWQGLADAGDADAQFNLAQAYRFGRGVKQDLAKAEELYGSAANKGHVQASDNYGLLVFQRGEYARALPFVRAAADRGDPRAQYLLGIAHFNGDIVPKDWVRAYALESLARQAGLPQATAALQQMDQAIPLEQRQQAASLASQLAEDAIATRARQLAAVDLGAQAPASATSPPEIAMRMPRSPGVAASAPLRPPGSAMRSPLPQSTPRTAAGSAPLRPPGSAMHSPMPDSPRSAGADYSLPQPQVAIAPPPQPFTISASASRPTPKPVATAVPGPSNPGVWRVQLGAFGVPGNAEALWNKVRGHPAMAGHSRILLPAGGVTKLQAGGFASQADAQSACARLAAAGYSCLAVRN